MFGLIRLFALTALLVALYPIVTTLLCQAVFPYQSNGSLIREGDEVIGSALVGQLYTQPYHFYSRPSPSQYDPRHSGGFNQGLDQPAFRERILKQMDTRYPMPKMEMTFMNSTWEGMTGSASGLDPHISLQDARRQAPRIAQALHINPIQVLVFVNHRVQQSYHREERGHVSTLALNQMIDQQFATQLNGSSQTVGL